MTALAELDAAEGAALAPAVSNHFPREVRDALVLAARTPMASETDLSRLKAINRAIERARLKYPELFRVEGACG